MERGTPESVVEAFVACINFGDLDGIAALTAPRYTFTDMEGDVYVFEGDEAANASWDEYLSAYPDYRILVEHVMRSGDGVAIVGRSRAKRGRPLDRRARGRPDLRVADLLDADVREGVSRRFLPNPKREDRDGVETPPRQIPAE
jgi:hypothetical protein